MIRKQSHDGSLATVRAICFRVHHGCIILEAVKNLVSLESESF